METDNKQSARPQSVILGFVGAFIGALFGCIPWMIVLYFGYVVSWLGFVIGFCSRKGYELLGGKEGKVKVVVVVGMSILGVLFAQYASTCISVFRDFNAEGQTIEISEVIQLINDAIMTSAEIRIAFLKDLGIGILFAVLGLWKLVKEMNATTDMESPGV